MQSRTELKEIYHSQDFRNRYCCPNQHFGAICGDQGTTFCLWSPLAKSVRVMLYRDGADSECFSALPMLRRENGVWECFVPENLHGIYYLYELIHDTEPILSPDPYARSCGLNGRRSMVVDLSRTNPDGWEKDRSPKNTDQTIIYELHVKEFSWQKAGGFPEAVRGKYKAFTCPNTTLHGDGIHPTGLGYLKNLGITDVQLMPIFDYGSVDEADPTAFNWGYDPVNYNIPEGSYATDPTDGCIRIRECKEMIHSLHKNGFRVIMDVVFNHTYSLDSCLNRCVPWYYYRLHEDGSPSDGSGCGNDIASEEPMCAKYILDSVLYWAKEYHIDGFRFDLMGLMDVELMNRIRTELDKIWGSGEKRIYGEPWSAQPTAMAPTALPADKAHMKFLEPGIGMFCDDTRDAIKGNVFDTADPGFVNGGIGLEESILQSVSAWCSEPSLLRASSQHISYVSSHDNLTLWDKLQQTTFSPAQALACNRLAAAIYMTCQGIPFFLSGEEFCRTKNGLDNTYRESIELNQLNWELAWENQDLVCYYTGLIALRKQCPGLCDQTVTACHRIFDSEISNGLVRLCIYNESDTTDSSWKTLCIFYHAGNSTFHANLPAGRWQILADGTDSFRWRKHSFISGHAILKGPSALILGK